MKNCFIRFIFTQLKMYACCQSFAVCKQSQRKQSNKRMSIFYLFLTLFVADVSD